MEIQLESPEQHTIRSYSNEHIVINDKTYYHSLIISKQAIDTDWPIQSILDLTDADLALFIAHKPEILILGHQSTHRPSPHIASALATHRIGLESMNIGAACRTFNVLLGEGRAVVLGIILNHSSRF